MLVLSSNNVAVRKRWATALQERFKFCEAGTLTEIVDQLKNSPCELLLVHRTLVDGIQLVDLCQQGSSKVFILSDRPADKEGLACLKAGCVGYANTFASSVRLIAAVETILSGRVWMGSSLLQHLLSTMAEKDGDGNRSGDMGETVLVDLSPREEEIARFVADGRQNLDIAYQLGITERTVKAHLSSIYAKTGCSGRLDLALRVRRG
jgi:DNA-binding NarL/FixJ family response regulator